MPLLLSQRHFSLQSSHRFFLAEIRRFGARCKYTYQALRRKQRSAAPLPLPLSSDISTSMDTKSFAYIISAASHLLQLILCRLISQGYRHYFINDLSQEINGFQYGNSNFSRHNNLTLYFLHSPQSLSCNRPTGMRFLHLYLHC